MAKKKKAREVSDQELADARLMVALEILDSENASDILDAMNNLLMTQAARAYHLHKKGGKKQKRRAQMWKHSADEFFTIVMCAVYQHQDATSGEDSGEDLL